MASGSERPPILTRRSRSSLVVQQLPAIAEDDAPAPLLPDRSNLRQAYEYNSSSAGSPIKSPPPPSYSIGAYSVGFPSAVPSRKRVEPEKTPQDQERFLKRQRMYRLVIIAIVLVAVIVGLAVGVTLGLRKSNQSTATSSNPIPNDIFPLGSYSFTTALSSASTGCTTNPATFRCFPFATYTPGSPDDAAATFSWVITSLNSYSYAISSSPNPFAPSFSNIPLAVQDANQFSEHLVFNFTMSKAVVAAARLDPTDSLATTCYFNETVMSASLWTRMRADYPASIAGVPAPKKAGNSFAPWPYRVEVSQIQDGGQGSISCVDASGRSVGGDLSAHGSCGCYYANYNLGNRTTQT